MLAPRASQRWGGCGGLAQERAPLSREVAVAPRELSGERAEVEPDAPQECRGPKMG